MKNIYGIILVVTLLSMILCTGSLARTLVISKVINGEEFELEGGEKAVLVGVDAPDSGEYLYQEVTEFVTQELEGKKVACRSFQQRDLDGKDAYYDDKGYLHMQIECGKDYQTDFNALMLEKGYARVNETDLPMELEHYRKLERQAREGEVGIWGE
jgi:endonuclease YncB( thermonuclease family)